LRDGVWTLGQVGDSRAYLCKKEGLVRITHDHSLVEEMVREGALTEQQAREHALRHIITRAVGIDPVLEVDFYTLRLAAGDRMLLCSDGLSDMVPEEALRDILRREESAQAAVEALIAEANRRGGRDNITAIVVEEGGANHG
jgi:serine/threonine protein phosphatase PrpC